MKNIITTIASSILVGVALLGTFLMIYGMLILLSLSYPILSPIISVLVYVVGIAAIYYAIKFPFYIYKELGNVSS